MSEPYLQDPDVTILLGDALEQLRTLPDESVHCVATSPPFYGLRDYGTGRWEGGDADCDHAKPVSTASIASSTITGGKATVNEQQTGYRDLCGKCGARRVDQQIGLEASPDEWASRLVDVFREARRVLRADGTLWVECGDSYYTNGTGSRSLAGDKPLGASNAGTYTGYKPRSSMEGLKPKDLIGAPWLLAFALRADGWWLRGCNIWAKPNAMPESAKDRCTTAHSYVFQFAKSARYFFDGDAISEENTPGTFARFGKNNSLASNTPKALAAEQEHWGNGRRSDMAEVRLDGKHPRSVWTIPTQGFPEAHFATWPEALARRIILAAVPEQVCEVCGKARERIVERELHPVQKNFTHTAPRDGFHKNPEGHIPAKQSTTTLGFTDCGHNAYRPGVVLDPFGGSGTTALVARKLGRRAVLIELNEQYAEMAARRLQQQAIDFSESIA